MRGRGGGYRGHQSPAYSQPHHINSHHYKTRTPTPKHLTRDEEELKRLKEQVQDLSSKLQDKHKSPTPHAKEVPADQPILRREKPTRTGQLTGRRSRRNWALNDFHTCLSSSQTRRHSTRLDLWSSV